MKDFAKSNYIIKICMVLFFTVLIAFQVTVRANDTKYEIYNNGKFTGISSIMRYYSDSDAEPDLYINIKDIYKLGLKINDIKNGISLSNSLKSINIFFDDEPLCLGGYTFNNAIIDTPLNDFLRLDIIGKCFSDIYKGEMVNDVWKISLDINDPITSVVSDSIIVKSTIFNFNHNIYSVNVENQSYDGFENINIYTAYYKRDGALLYLDITNKYSIEPKEEFTTFVPIQECFDDAGTIKIMMWDGRNIPISDIIIPKSYKYDSSLIPPENFEEREKLFADIEVNNKYYDAIYVMHSNFSDIGMFNGYEDGTYKIHNNILKSEFSHTLTKLIGVDLKNIDIDYNFVDVPNSHWCKNGAAYVVSKGYLSEDNGHFYPNKYITLDEVLSAFLKILGEKDFTSEMIINLSDKYNLLKNIDIEEIEITRGNFAQLSYNFMKEYSILPLEKK